MHVLNYDYKDYEQIGKHMSKQKPVKIALCEQPILVYIMKEQNSFPTRQ